MPLPQPHELLAPGGKLRAAINLGNPVLAQRKHDGSLAGVSVALARELATRLEADIDFVVFDAAGKVVSACESQAWDIAFLARDPKRAETIAFTEPYVNIEGTYLVSEDSDIFAIEDMDRSEHTIAVGKGAAYDLYLSRTLQHAQIIRAPTSAEAVTWKVDRALDAAAGVRQPLEHFCTENPGYRVLPGRFTAIEQAMAVPAQNANALAFLQSFLRSAKDSGLIAQALEASGQNPALQAP